MANGLPWTATFTVGDYSEFNRGFAGGAAMTVVAGGLSGNAARGALTSGTENEDIYAENAVGDYPSIGLDKITEIWMVMYAKLDAGYNFPNNTQKIFILQYTNGIINDRTYQIYMFWDDEGVIGLDRAQFTSGSSFTLIPQNTNLPAYEWEPGTWAKFKIHVRNNTSGNSDGVVQLWINDVLKVDRSDINIVGSDEDGIGKIILSGYTNDATDTNGVQWWDSFHAADTDPEAGVGGARVFGVRA